MRRTLHRPSEGRPRVASLPVDHRDLVGPLPRPAIEVGVETLVAPPPRRRAVADARVGEAGVHARSNLQDREVGGAGRSLPWYRPPTGRGPVEEDPDAAQLLSRYRPRTVSTGQGADVTTREATLPRKSLASPVRPWVPSTITSAFFDRAARTICSSATPSRISVLVFTPAARALSCRAFSRFSAYLRADVSRSS